MAMNIIIIGASGAIGSAMTEQLATKHSDANILAFSRSEKPFSYENVTTHPINITDEKSIGEAANISAKLGKLDMVLVTTGILHGPNLAPEKSLKDLSMRQFNDVFAINTFGPALVAKHFLPHLHREKRAIFAAISARVGSISDNYLGGWYAYRASKAALNMIIKNASIEMARRYKKAIIIGLHPGTVDSELSKPFQASVPDGKLFSPELAAKHLLDVLETKTPEDSGKCFAWDDSIIEF